MGKKKTAKSKQVRKPTYCGRFPFTLATHLCTNAANDWQSGDLDLVSRCGDLVILRMAEDESVKAYPTAKPPPGEERINSIASKESAEHRKHIEQSTPVELWNIASAALCALKAAAEKGSAEALWLFTELAHDASNELRRMSNASPRSFQPFVKTQITWPLMTSRHPLMSEDPSKLSAIGLGDDIPLQLDGAARWKPDPATDYAIQLLDYLGENAYSILPPFSKDTAMVWWEAAKGVLLYSYPEPQSMEEFRSMITSKSKLRSAGRTRQAIFDKLAARFEAMAKIPG